MAQDTQGRGHGRKPTTHAAKTAERERQALDLRKAGATFDQIAERCGFTNRSAAYKAVKRGLTSTLQEPADELRTLESERLDRLFLAVWRQAIDGDLKAVDRAIRISERRSKLFGLDINPALEKAAEGLPAVDAWLRSMMNGGVE